MLWFPEPNNLHSLERNLLSSGGRGLENERHCWSWAVFTKHVLHTDTISVAVCVKGQSGHMILMIETWFFFFDLLSFFAFMRHHVWIKTKCFECEHCTRFPFFKFSHFSLRNFYKICLAQPICVRYLEYCVCLSLISSDTKLFKPTIFIYILLCHISWPRV